MYNIVQRACSVRQCLWVLLPSTHITLEVIIMAIGFAGSGGGIPKLRRPLTPHEVVDEKWYRQFPPDISLFVNRKCNLACQHCYVAYKDSHNALSLPEWYAVLHDLIRLGARRFGIVGMEPTVAWKKTYGILSYLAHMRTQGYSLVTGMVTNGIELDYKKCQDLLDVGLCYLDISIDGSKSIHDTIRGDENFDLTMESITRMPVELREKLFISFTCNQINKHSFPDVVDLAYQVGIRQFVFSPYATVGNVEQDTLFVSVQETIEIVEDFLRYAKVFNGKENVLIYVKGDPIVSMPFLTELAEKRLVSYENLQVDQFGMMFTEHNLSVRDDDNNRVIFNYYPVVPPLSHSMRLFDDGRVGRCTDMFYVENSPGMVGNVRDTPIKTLLGL